MSLFVLIMAGGLGTRLWPLTAKGLPKAFLSFDGTGVSLLQRTILRSSLLTSFDNIFIVAGRSHEKELRRQAQNIPDENLILEPVGRDTLPCIGFAGLYIKRRDPFSIMVVLPGEQFIKDEAEFQNLVTYAVESARNCNCAVTLGIKPTFPATGFGYTQLGDKISDKGSVCIFKSQGFTEKPDKKKASEFLSSGQYFWNSGIYILPTLLLFEMISKFAPDIYSGLSAIEDTIGTPKEKETIEQIYPNMRNISIDYAITEKLENILVIPADIGWNDMGTWQEVAETWEKDDHSNYCLGRYIGIDSDGCVIYSPDKLVATVGVRDMIIVNTPDGLLLCAKDRADDVKLLVQKLMKEGDE